MHYAFPNILVIFHSYMIHIDITNVCIICLRKITINICTQYRQDLDHYYKDLQASYSNLPLGQNKTNDQASKSS